jgi:hypothetical protein
VERLILGGCEFRLIGGYSPEFFRAQAVADGVAPMQAVELGLGVGDGTLVRGFPTSARSVL